MSMEVYGDQERHCGVSDEPWKLKKIGRNVWRNLTGITGLVFAVFCSSAPASIVTTQSFTYPTDQILIDSAVTGVGGTSYSITDGSTDPTLSVQPFAGNPADLVSFTVEFNLTYDATQQNGPNGVGFSASAGGGFFFDDVSFDGNGNGTGNGGAPGALVGSSFNIVFSNTYLASDAGIVYNPALLDFVLGGEPFNLRFDHSPSIQPDATAVSFSMSIREGSSFSVTYTAIPEPSTLLLLFGGALLVYFRRR